MICENCGKEHDGSFGSGRFCSRSCSCKFNGRQSNKNGKLTSHPNYNIECKGNKPRVEGWKCKWCDLIFKSRRERTKHTNEVHIRDKSHSWNYGLTKESSCKIRQYAETFSKRYKGTGIFSHPISEETRRKISEAANKRLFGGWYSSKRIIYNGIRLDSTFELSVAKSLDYNHIKWSRPNFMYWFDWRGKIHRYFPDFYLPDYDVYLDPKNDYLINNKSARFGITDVEKIRIVEIQNSVRILILNKEYLSWEKIKSLILI